MASACMKMSSDTFPTSPKYGWLSPRISFSREFPTTDETTPNKTTPDPDFLDFEFRSNDSVSMLTADQLFSNGKLLTHKSTTSDPFPNHVVTSPNLRRGNDTDICMFSPKAPRCSSRWKEILGLKKHYQSNVKQFESVSSSFKNLLQRNTKTNVDSPSSFMKLPLLNELESDIVTVSARLSLSSSSSSGGHEHEDLPRLSLDLDNNKLNNSNNNNNSCIHPRKNGRLRERRSLSSSENGGRVGKRNNSVGKANEGVLITVDSPRMNSSGKIVFHNLERSSSSPSSFNGGLRSCRYRGGMERSYSANVRVTPLLNVPVCSLRGFPLFSSSQSKKENSSSGGGGSGGGGNKNQSKNRTSIEK